MRKYFLLFLFFCTALFVKAGEPLNLPTLTINMGDHTTFNAMTAMDSILASTTQAYNDDKEAKRMAYNAKYGTYTPKREMELTSVPLIAFGFLAKNQKRNFRAARNNFIPSYKNGMDDYIQFAPALTTYALNLAGYKGRSSFKRLSLAQDFHSLSWVFLSMA